MIKNVAKMPEALEGFKQCAGVNGVDDGSQLPKRKRVLSAHGDAASALKACECGFDATLNSQPLVKCRMSKCMTQWVRTLINFDLLN